MTESSLKKQRGNIRASISRLDAFINKSSISTARKGEIAERTNKLRDTWDDFHTLHNKILDELGEEATAEAIDAEENILEEYEQNYYRLIGRLEDFLDVLTPQTATPVSSGEQSIATTPLPSLTPGNFHSYYKLPTLSMPKFDGSLSNWITFKDAFESMIHCDNKIPPVHKFAYLRDCLVGPAARMIHTLKTSDANYAVAWKGLCDRFENKRLIIDTHVNALFSLKSLEKESGHLLRDFIDEFMKHIGALETLSEPTLDTILIHLCSSKLDINSKDKWEEHRVNNDNPAFKELVDFLKERCQILESRQSSKMGTDLNINTIKSHKPRVTRGTSSLSAVKGEKKCYKCNSQHSIYTCKEFLALNVSQRIADVARLNLCPNCLVRGHDLSNCRARSCKHCNQRHNSLIHNASDTVNEVTRVDNPPNTFNCLARGQGTTVVLLATAIVNIEDSRGNLHECRALLDSGSQSNFIKQSVADRLNSTIKKIHLPLIGIGNNLTHITGKLTAKVCSLHDNRFKATLDFLCIPQITQYHPQTPIDPQMISIPQNIRLADPQFHQPRDIDMLLGASSFWNLLCIGQIKLGNLGSPILQKTRLGWIISGDVIMPTTPSTSCHLSLSDQMCKFWEVENTDVSSRSILSIEQRKCEDHYAQTTTREADGRYVVRLPFNNKLDQLGDSRATAGRRLLSTERRLLKDPQLREEYLKFMHDYLGTGHMRPIEHDDGSGFYLPHHAVKKEDSTTTKVRVVFDGSSKSSSGLSLNDVLMCGPTLQDTLFDLLVRFRLHRYALVADIKQMYRQIKVSEEDAPYQKILWRWSTDEPIQTFQLQTVTYGTTSAPYQATKTLLQVAHDEGHAYPMASAAVMRDFYVDDCISGSDTIPRLIQLRAELEELLLKGGFHLRKWRSNCEDVEGEVEALPFDRHQNSKTLGLLWNASRDQFTFSRPQGVHFRSKVTKRLILSQLAQVFDPLGLLGPVTIIAKMLIQELWQSGIHWDASVPMDLFTRWNTYINDLEHIKDITIPRWASMTNPSSLELHGFCDASERAYGAVVYLKTSDYYGQHKIHLLASKSRVSPLKVQTLPRLELSGAVVVTQLMNSIKKAMMMMTSIRCHYWTDSTIVLAWIRSESTHYQTFVANRIAEIQESTSAEQWHHVPSTRNPADILSRGIAAPNLINARLWWNGPEFLEGPQAEWPEISDVLPSPPEGKRKYTVALAATTQDLPDLTVLNEITSLRSIGYVLRWRNNMKVPKEERIRGPLTVEEVHNMMLHLIKIIQGKVFMEDLRAIRARGQVNANSRLQSLTPFLDNDGVVRVGGRLHHSDLPFNSRHPIIIPGKHAFTQLLVLMVHKELLHGGPRLVLNSIRQRYWPIHGMSSVKKYIKLCFRCLRLKPVAFQPLIGSLPKERFLPTRPFTHAGLDFCGPFFTKPFRTRGSKSHKAYICIFVCFASKAVHLELALDLSTDAFIQCLQRFVSRRGRPATFHSDNGTNFQGACNWLKDVISRLLSDPRTAQWASEQNITWKFIPPYTPHMGGLWEAAVKSAKGHLRKIMGNNTLSYDEWLTLLCQIEAVLNSRPITPLSDDARDLTALTPGHFLIGAPLMSLPEDNLQGIPENRLNFYQQVTAMKQTFWKRWSLDYLNQLQVRSKWARQEEPPKIGELVAIKSRNSPPLSWSLGRIKSIHPGFDNTARVVTVRTSRGDIKAAIRNLCPLRVDH